MNAGIIERILLFNPIKRPFCFCIQIKKAFILSVDHFIGFEPVETFFPHENDSRLLLAILCSNSYHKLIGCLLLELFFDNLAVGLHVQKLPINNYLLVQTITFWPKYFN